MSPDGGLVVVTSETTNMVHLIDAESQSIADNILVAARPRYAAFTPDGKKLWVSNESAGTVSQLSHPQAFMLVLDKSVEVGPGAYGLVAIQ